MSRLAAKQISRPVFAVFSFRKPRLSIKFLACLLTAFLCSSISAETVWIDVRSVPEHALDHIDGDLRVSYQDVREAVEAEFPDKSTAIRLYCRSGGRAEKARAALLDAGYTDVENLGSIDQARQFRNLTDE